MVVTNTTIIPKNIEAILNCLIWLIPNKLKINGIQTTATLNRKQERRAYPNTTKSLEFHIFPWETGRQRIARSPCFPLSILTAVALINANVAGKKTT